MLKAIIKKISHATDSIIFETEDFGYGCGEIMTVIDERLLQEGDEISGDLENYGTEEIIITKNGMKIEIYIEDFGLSYEEALALFSTL